MSNRKRLISNFLSLSGVQAISYILPLITVPYLVRILGPEKFGLIAFAQAFILYFSLIADYGFNLSATRKISINRNNKERISEIFSSVMCIKIVLMILSFLVMCLIVFSFNKFKTEWLVYLLTFGMVVGNVLFPAWLFLGMESMRQIAIFNLITKVFYAVSIFIFIKNQSDYIYIPLINSIGLISAGLLSLWVAVKHFAIKIKTPGLSEIKRELKDGWHIFISQIAQSIYTISNPFILGIFTSNVFVGYYSAGEKIVRAVQWLSIPLLQTVYPHISKLAQESKESALVFVRKIVKIASVPAFFFSLGLLIFAPQISDFILGKQFRESMHVIRILSFLPFIAGLSSIFGTQVMLNFGMKKVYMRILMIAGLVNIFFAIILVNQLQHIGVSIAILITEIFVLSSMFYLLQRNGLKVLPFNINVRIVK